MTVSELKILLTTAKFPEEIFGDDSNKVKVLFKTYAFWLHPDKTFEDEPFKLLTKWHQEALRKITLGTYGQKVLATITSKKNSYELISSVPGALSEVYSATNKQNRYVVLKVVRNKANKQFLLNEYNTLTRLHKEAAHNLLLTHVPEVVETFEVDGRQTNAINALTDYYTLEEVNKTYPKGVDGRTMAWMFNRVFGALVLTHSLGLVHNAITPDHVMIRPHDHNGVLLDWCYATEAGQKVKAISKKWEYFYPSEMWTREVDFGADIYMGAKCMIYVLGGDPKTETMPDTVPRKIQSFLRYCLLGKNVRPRNAMEAFSDFKEVLELTYGTPKFHPFTMMPSN